MAAKLCGIEWMYANLYQCVWMLLSERNDLIRQFWRRMAFWTSKDEVCGVNKAKVAKECRQV